VESQITDCLLTLAGVHLSDADFSLILSQNMRTLLNMVPNNIDLSLKTYLNDSNLLQPLEMLGGQSMCDLLIAQPDVLEEKLQAISETEIERLSLLELWISDFSEE
jgi:hypothetical protein